MRLDQLSFVILTGLWLSDLPAEGSAGASDFKDGSMPPFSGYQAQPRSASQVAETDPSGEPQYEITIDGFQSARDRALRPTEFMTLGAESEPWLPRYIDVLKKSRPPYARPETVALIDGEDGARYLVLDWAGPKWDSFHDTFLALEIHKVVRSERGGLRLKWLRSFPFEITRLYPPTGQAVFKGEAPIAVVFVWVGGSHPASTGLRLIQMKRNSVDITPDWAGRTVDVVDLDGDGAFEVVAMDERWRGILAAGLFGPYLPVILSRAHGRFFHDCRRLANLYRRWIKKTEVWARETSFGEPYALMIYWATAYLAHIQIGEFADARADLARLVTLAENQPPYELTSTDVTNAFAPVLGEAMANQEDPCPVSMVDFRRLPGGDVTSFSRRFRPDAD